MEVSTALLLRTPLFRGIPQEALPALLEGLGARKRRCGRGEVVLRRGERADLSLIHISEPTRPY